MLLIFSLHFKRRKKNLPYMNQVYCNISLPHVTFILFMVTVIILNIGTDRSEQTVQTQILMEQSDQGLLCLLFCLHLLNTILHCKIQLFQL